jgi:DNA-binding SARP family transcriptional activator/cytochrome c-type biogenesis protein CcmH/NrfG
LECAVPADQTAAALLLQRPKHLALLIYLALQNGTLTRRDTLLALFWPELDEAHARNTLSKTLGRIRSCLGDDLLRAIGAHEVGLRPGALRSDVEEFRAALTREDWAGAIELYRGDFLDGFHLPATAFETWAAELREQLRSDALSAAQRLAQAQEQAKDVRAALVSLRRALMIRPTDEGVVRRVMSLLHENGDRAGALAAYQTLEDALRAELDAAPNEELRELALTIRGSSKIRSLAVMPLVNLTGSPDQQHLADGLTDLVITELARTRVARITSRQSSLQLAGSTLSLADVGRLLDVDAVIEGTLTRYGDLLSISAQLVRVEPEAHLWAERLDTTLGDLPNVAERVARAVEAVLRPDEGIVDLRTAPARAQSGQRQRRVDVPVDPIAIEAYLKGRHFSVMLPQLGKAIAAYNEAITRAPDLAPAWAGLASAFAIVTLLAHGSPDELFPPFRHAAEQAVRLDPELGEAHTSLGLYRMLAERDWQGADDELRVGAELAAGSAEPLIHRAVFLAAMGRFDEARALTARARVLDPLAASVLFAGAWCEHKAGAHNESNVKLRALLDLHPHFGIGYIYLGLDLALLGESNEAAVAVRQGLDLLPNNAEALGLGAAALARAGQSAEAAGALARLLALREVQYLDPWAVACAYAGLGKVDEAVSWFRRMYDERSPSAFCVAHDSLHDDLRAEPGFRDVLRRLAFPVSASRAPSSGRAYRRFQS